MLLLTLAFVELALGTLVVVCVWGNKHGWPLESGLFVDSATTLVAFGVLAAACWLLLRIGGRATSHPTRGRESNIVQVVCDGHDHQELGLGDRSPRDAFAAAMQRDPDGNLSAHTIAERWHNERPARNAARAADRRVQQAETFWPGDSAPCRHGFSRTLPGAGSRSRWSWRVAQPGPPDPPLSWPTH